MSEPPPSIASRARALARERPETVALVVAAIVVRLAFWIFTGRDWEDALITEAHARNAALGLGLVHHAGEGRVHGFTSALSVLLPLVGEIVKSGSGLFVLRTVSLFAGAAAVALVSGIARAIGLARGPTAFAMAYVAFERNQVFYAMAGMETGVAVAVLLASIFFLLKSKYTAGGVALGFALLARPDFVLFVVPATFAIAFQDRKIALRTIAIATAVVLPWIIFTTAYYGSPVPHTILAKAAASPAPPWSGDMGAWAKWTFARLELHRYDWASFAPFTSDGFIASAPVSPWVLYLIALATIGLAIVGVAFVKAPPVWRAARAYFLVFTIYRVVLLPTNYSEWYFPPSMAIFAIEVAAGLTVVARRAPRLATGIAIALAVAFASPLPATFIIERRIQKEIEEPVRRELGLWLHENVPEGEAVGCEPAGYFGFYGRVTLYDWPGLTSPTVRRALGDWPREDRTLTRAIAVLHPPWLALRPDELRTLVEKFPATAARYRLVKTFAVSDELRRIEWGGVAKDDFDTKYLVLHEAKKQD